MIEIKELTKYGKDTVLLDGVSVKLNNGVAYGVLDVKGESAHALLALLAGATLPDGGVLRINGFDVAKEADRARECVGYLPRGFEGYPDMTPDEYLVFVSEAKNMEYEIAMHSVHELTGEMELRGRRATLGCHLTPAEHRRLGLAQALMGDPEFIVLDDPTDGLGDRDARDLIDRICALAEKKTLFMSSSSLLDLRAACDVILVLDGGSLVGVYDADERALDGVYADLCEKNGIDAEDGVNSALLRRRKTTGGRRRRVAEREGRYELIDDDES